MMQRPVWLFSMDSDQFWAAPSTTGGLKAYYHKYGSRQHRTHIELVHFRNAEAIRRWRQQWIDTLLLIAEQALQNNLQPVAGFSCYTWNAAEFLALIQFLKRSCPQLLIIAGGPHVQQVEDYLFDDPIDLISLGEGEASLQQVLDCDGRQDWHRIPGLAYLDSNGALHKTAGRERTRMLDDLPSALDVIELTDKQGKPLYESYAYETSRGCPFTCAFCEWGTGAIGGKMYQFSLPRIKRDWQRIIAAGIKDIWLADSNFGALKEDLAKAQLICELKTSTGLPSTFATSWSKKHSPRVQEIVLLLNRHGLLPHYQLALQTLTPAALELSHRKNMGANKYQPIAKQMAEQGVPIAAELIWGLPGDNLADFETNLDSLLANFPTINIFGYTLLPGTEFYQKRDDYRIDAIPVAGYGKAKGEYVVACHSFNRNEGMEGYWLIAAHSILNHGYIIPLTIRYLALAGSVPVSSLLRTVLRQLIEHVSDDVAALDLNDRMTVYENRDRIYLAVLNKAQRCFDLIETTISHWLQQHRASQALVDAISKTLQLDRALCPRYGNRQTAAIHFTFNANGIHRQLAAMELPSFDDFASQPQTLTITTPGGAGDVLKDPDGGSWLKGQIIEPDTVEHDTIQHNTIEPDKMIASDNGRADKQSHVIAVG